MVRDTPPADDYSWRGQVGRLVNGMPIEVDPPGHCRLHILRYFGKAVEDPQARLCELGFPFHVDAARRGPRCPRRAARAATSRSVTSPSTWSPCGA